MESVIPNMEKGEENYKVPNLEKGIAVLEYLSLRPQGETLQDIKNKLDISQTTAYRNTLNNTAKRQTTMKCPLKSENELPFR